MKKIVYLITLSVLAFNSIVNAGTPVKYTPLSGTITISGAFALYPIAVKWAEEFKKLHPEVKFDITAGGAGKGITDALTGLADIGLVSRDINPEETKKGAFPIAITKDAVIPIINAKHPLMADLQAKGIKKSALQEIFITSKYKTWTQAIGAKNNIPIHVYTRSDAAGAAESWAKYFGKKQEDLQGVGVYGDPGLAQAVKKDPVGIGFNNIVFVYDSKTHKATNGVVPLPIDINNNGKIDADEAVYETIDKILDAIAAGKYPSPPARDLYFVTKGTPKNKLVADFIKYVLTDGQKFVGEAGYVGLSKDKIAGELKKVK